MYKVRNNAVQFTLSQAFGDNEHFEEKDLHFELEVVDFTIIPYDRNLTKHFYTKGYVYVDIVGKVNHLSVKKIVKNERNVVYTFDTINDGNIETYTINLDGNSLLIYNASHTFSTSINY